jgi:hypothetical protein
MILGHIAGIPVEETVLLAPASATVTVVAIVGRAKLGRLLDRIRGRAWRQ